MNRSDVIEQLQMNQSYMTTGVQLGITDRANRSDKETL